MRSLLLLLAWLLLALPPWAHAACRLAPGEPVSVAACAGGGHVELDQAVRLRPAQPGETPAAVLRLPASAWSAGTGASANLGIGAAPHWLEARVVNDGAHARNLLLDVGNPTLDRLELHVVVGERVVARFTAGDHLPFSARPVAHRHFVFPLELPAGAEARLLLRVDSGGAMQVPLKLWEPPAFLNNEQQALGVHALFAGVMLAMVVYNGFIYLSMRDRTYLWYALSMLAVTGTVLSLKGLLAQFLWPGMPALNDVALLVCIFANLAFATLFADRFLALRRLPRAVSAWFRTLAAAGVVGLVLAPWLPYVQTARVAGLLVMVGAASGISVGIYLWWRGEVLARFYTVAWFMFLAGTVLVTLNKMGLLPPLGPVLHAMQAGAAAEALLLSFALAYRFTQERRERFRAQRKLIQVQSRANAVLEQRVRERTEALQEANRRLQEANSLDGLTQVRNRQFFDDMLALEWQRARRAGSQLCLLMVDGDHFKRINDQHGHLAGDACLRHLAQIYQAGLQRSGDFVARYGGEEFAILLPHADLDSAARLAQRIRQRVEATPLAWEGKHIAFTISIGVAGCVPPDGQDASWLIKQADLALYEAKRQGRNRVCTSVCTSGCAAPADTV